MIDVLQARYPRIAAALARIPPPRVSRAPIGWSILAAAGASFFASALLTMFFALTLRVLGAYPAAWASGIVTVIALAVALGVAYVAGGRYALVAYAAWIAVDRLLLLGTQLRFCAAVFPAPASCSLFAYLGSLWPYVLGAALGYGLLRWMRAADGTGNPLLEAAGALALTEAVTLTTLRTFFFAPTDLEAGLMQLIAAVLSGILCGFALLRRVDAAAKWRVLAIVAVVLLGLWALVTLPASIAQVGIGGRIAVGMVGLIAFVFPFVELGAAALVLYMAAARRVAATAS